MNNQPLNSKSEYRNTKQIRSTEIRNSKRYDLEERTLEFARQVRGYIKELPRSLSNQEYSRQLIRASASVGANYIEANEALSKKDFIMRIKISKKEAKESLYWLKLTEPIADHSRAKEQLLREANELMNILGAIYRKSTAQNSKF